MKPRDSSEEGQGLAGDAGAEPASLVVAARVPQGGPGRSESGVVAAPRADAAVYREDEDDPTTVDLRGLPVSGDQQAALARRIRTALEHTLPLGTPVPQSVGTKGTRSSYAQTMLLGGRQLPGVAVAPGANISPTEELQGGAASADSSTPAAPAAAVVSPLPSPSRPPPEPSAGDASALRASFVRPVGLPTAPPPRRSRRPGAPDREPGSERGGWSERVPSSERAPISEREARSERAPASEPDHEAFALDRPRASQVPGIGRPAPAASGSAAGHAAVRPVTGSLSIGLMLPPPPQPGDYDAPSSDPPALDPPSSDPASSDPPSLPRAAVAGPPSTAAPAPAPVQRPAAARVSVPPLLSELPSANPFEGFEAPRETFAQRSLIVFVVALAVVGLIALGAIAFGFLGKTGW